MAAAEFVGGGAGGGAGGGPLSKFGSGDGVWGPQPWRYCLALALVVRDLCCGQLRVFG